MNAKNTVITQSLGAIPALPQKLQSFTFKLVAMRQSTWAA